MTPGKGSGYYSMPMLEAVNWGTQNPVQPNSRQFLEREFSSSHDGDGGNGQHRAFDQAEAAAFTKALQLYETFLAIDWHYQGDNISTRMNLMVYFNGQPERIRSDGASRNLRPGHRHLQSEWNRMGRAGRRRSERRRTGLPDDHPRARPFARAETSA